MTVNQSPAWNALTEHAKDIGQSPISKLFTSDPDRFKKLSYSAANCMLDFSKQRITQTTIEGLINLAEQQNLQQKIEALFKGDIVNPSENRPALHTALRQPEKESLIVNGTDISAEIHHSLVQMESLVDQIHNGQWRGYDGSPIKHVVNIGVGGSDLGPLMTCRALSQFAPTNIRHIDLHFVSSMDGSQLAQLLDRIDPPSTLFIVSSKSFSTIDTLANSNTAREWLINASGMSIELISQHHFIGITASPKKAAEWGIPEKNQLHFWDWTGGRYSMWSVIGMAIALKVGNSNFREFLAGANTMDSHFREAPLAENLPVLLAMIGIWNINFQDIHAHAILPYDGRLAHLPAYLEQLEMESNGKNVTLNGHSVDYATCPILWGEVGPNAQHAFYQLLHQGTESVMCDFIAPALRYQDQGEELQQQHQLALANCLAQSRLLALGDSMLDNAENSPIHKRYTGNQPSTTIMLDQLSPLSFGALIALYEHKVYVQSAIWEINPFDQWGVELGKQVATSLLNDFENTNNTNNDSSTDGLIRFVLQQRQTARNKEDATQDHVSQTGKESNQ
ncbi:glucose-6-phosphate isomerase [Amphritea balenae]|uniref:Glucose-6-phosphate isomerase n=1 Tax=Amphritea balenae TaxID=452629 RepID=A0A3P1SVJ1_9GAMM|nr:glucose-6-phosphate isomerase [Amphritea balenae]RRD00163.1 glucose-6-phosphate isomerase [Amphritea balenae]GGK77195.1 glucose-6-phosphate isomerase [Amphritea balenae]